MEFDTILYEVEERTAIITFNRPDQLNAISPHMAFELRRAYAAAEADGEVWTLLITANGRAFCTGADVTEIPDDGRVVYEEPYLSTYPQWEAPQEATPPFRTMTKPIITAVNGLCCGAGLDLVTCGDISIASERAEFFDPHVSIGLVSGREMVRLARVLPTGIAMRVALTGRHERVSAQRAYELGLISEVVEHDRLLERGKEVAGLVNRNAPLAVRGTRLAIRKGLDLPMHEAEILAETFRERVVRTDDARGGPGGLPGEAGTEMERDVSDGTRQVDPSSFTTIRYETSAATTSPPSRSIGPRCSTPSTGRCVTRCAMRGTSSRTTRTCMRSCCGPRATAPSAPASTRRSRTGSPTTSGTTRTPVSC